jgi:predicted lactoylglutathione lyase
MRLSNLFLSAIIVLAAVMCSTPDLDAQGREGQGQGGRQGRAGQGQGRGQQGRGQQGRGQQGRGFGGSRGGGGTTLLGLCQNASVQKEIDLVDEQKADLAKLRTSQEEARRSRASDRTGGRTSSFDREAYQKASPEEREKMIADARAARDAPEAVKKREAEAAARAKESAERQKKEDAKVAEILLPPQLARVKEIRVQLMGLRALSDTEVIAKLSITTAQQKQIKEIPEKAREASGKTREEAMAKLREAPQEERRELMQELFSGFREKAEAQQKETDTKVLAVLSAKQKTGLEGLKGKPFTLVRETRNRTGAQRGAQGRGQQGRGTQGRGNGDAAPSRGTQGRGGAAPSRGTQGRGNAPTTPEKPDDN